MLYNIPEQNIDRLRKKIVNIQKKCARYGCEFRYNEVGDHIETKTIRDSETGDVYTLTTKYIDVEVEGVARIGNWSFAGTIDHLETGNIINLVSDTFKAPERYLKCSPKCEHCNKIRSRKNTFLVYNNDTHEYKQVGRTCLKDYTGLDAEFCARMESFFHSVKESEDVEYTRTSHSEYTYFGVEDVLIHAYHLIKKDGYKKSLYSMDYDWNPEYTSTKEDVLSWFHKDTYNWSKFVPEDEDIQYVEEVIEYFRNINSEDSNDFMNKLHVICSEEYVSAKHIGLLVACLPTYYRILEDKKRDEERRNQQELEQGSEHVGEIGDKLEVKCSTFKTVYSFDTQFGTSWIYRFTDSNNNVYTWTTSTCVEDDKVVSIKGTVKKHDEYRGVKQTVLTRCRVSC